MGWVYSFHSLSPAIISDLSSLSVDQLRQRLIERGLTSEDVGAVTWDDDIDENEALTLLATTREWRVDKSLDDIRSIASLEPSQAPVVAALREMEDFTASQVPERFHSGGAGLMGIAMPPTIASAAEAAGRFRGPEGRRALTSGKASLVHRLFGGGVRRRLASDDHLWVRWLALGEALQHASDYGEWLGLHMA